MQDEMTFKREVWEKKILPFLRPIGDCLVFTGQIKSNGYGNICTHGKSFAAHRIALEVRLGVSLGVLFACHTCDNRACCNPSHLFAGTPRDNVQDATVKRRWRYGQDNPFAKVTNEQAAEIVSLRAKGVPRATVAAQFGLCTSTITRISQGIRYCGK